MLGNVEILQKDFLEKILFVSTPVNSTHFIFFSVFQKIVPLVNCLFGCRGLLFGVHKPMFHTLVRFFGIHTDACQHPHSEQHPYIEQSSINGLVLLILNFAYGHKKLVRFEPLQK